MKCCLVLPAFALALVGASACVAHSYRPEPVEKVLVGGLPNLLRLTLLDSSEVTLHDPQLAGDTLVGWNEPEDTVRPDRHIIRVPVALIRELRVGEPSLGRTAAAYGGFGAVLFLVAGIALALSLRGQAIP